MTGLVLLVPKVQHASILEFYADRNKSKIYSAKLYTRFKKEIKILAKHPNLGIKTEIESVRGPIVGEFVIYYEHHDNTIIIHTIWDSRQNPDKLTIR